MGTTLSGLAVLDTDQWAVLNVGDSRVYRYAGGRLAQLTVDHSAVQALVDAGLLDPRAALRHPRRNVVTRSLGTQPPPVPDIALRDPAVGERFLICSDGLTNELSDAEIGSLLAEIEDPQQAADQLVEQAVQAGGRDNVTVIVVQLEQIS
jgi:PPM family protein phosphatase